MSNRDVTNSVGTSLRQRASRAFYFAGAKSSLVSPFTVTLTVVALPLSHAVALYAPSGTSLME